MPSLKIDAEGILAVGENKILNALVASYKLSGRVIMNEQSTEGASGKNKNFDGYDDTAITINIMCFDTHNEKGLVKASRYDALEVINGAFKKLEGDTPVIYAFDFPLAKAINLHKGIIKTISVSSKKASSTLECDLELIEYEPDISHIQTQKKTIAETNKTSTNTTKKEETQEVMIDKEDEQLFQTGWVQ